MLPDGSADWLLLRADGVLELDLRATLRTDDGALISMRSFGLRHGPSEVMAAIGRGETVNPATYYFRTTPRFETAHPAYTFLNRLVAVASGDRRPEGPHLHHSRGSMNSRPLMLLRLTTAATEEIGSTPHGALWIFPVTGGSFEGERLRGKVLAGGGDWVRATAAGTFELDLRVTLETDDGALIHMTFTGVRDDTNRYLRTLPRFETAVPNTRS